MTENLQSLRLRALACLADPVLILDAEQAICYVNDAFAMVTGYRAADVLGHACSRLAGAMAESQTLLQIAQSLAAGHGFQGELQCARKDGSSFWAELSISPITDAAGRAEHFVGVLRNVTLERQLREQLRQQSLQDDLTGLPNRLALSEHLATALARALRRGKMLAIGLIDLDDFKPVNDRHGHAVGDWILQDVARRVQGHLRVTDYFARLGGDEFVVVVEDLDEDQAVEQLATLAERIQAAATRPYEFAAGQFVTVGMSMGMALYPRHGSAPDPLLSQADAALLTAKAHKHSRARWWAISGDVPRAAAPRSDAMADGISYGMVAERLLEPVQASLHKVVDQFAHGFYAEIRQRKEPTAILDQLTAEEFAHLKTRQSEHLLQLLAPTLTQQEHRSAAMQLGRVHAHVGIGSNEMIRAMQDYSSLLHRQIQKRADQLGYVPELTALIDERLKSEMQWELEGMGEVELARQSVLTHLEAQAETWVKGGSLVDAVLRSLDERLHAVRGTAYARPAADRQIVVIASTGCAGDFVRDVRLAGVNLSIGPGTAPDLSRDALFRAWDERRIVTTANYALDPGLRDIAEVARRHGIRSHAAIPILDANGNPVGVVSLFGAYPSQFESWSARLWLYALQQFFQRNAARDAVVGNPNLFIANDERKRYLALLHGGGLQMHVQPLIDLHTGAVVKVEALARLLDGEALIAPAKFLPICGDQDLAWLFRIGLRQSLQWLRHWDTSGLTISLGLNVPPSVLAMPEFPDWVRDELNKSDVEPHRLLLELLESEERTDQSRRDAAIEALAQMGVGLAMDDLGAGYSSLQRLQALPFGAVKIDQFPVRRAVDDPQKSIPFLGALVRMTQGMGMRVAMEGLESAELVEMAAGLGVDWGQGYAIARPMPPEHFLEWVSNWTWDVDPARPRHDLGLRAWAFSQESLSIDWKRAIESHQRWRDKFIERLSGRGRPLRWQIVCRDDKCHLGRWLHRQRKTLPGEGRALFDAVMEQHALFHRMAGDLARRAQEGNEATQVLDELHAGSLKEQSARLVALLQTLRRAAGRASRQWVNELDWRLEH